MATDKRLANIVMLISMERVCWLWRLAYSVATL
jgi:hypothetical protein